MEDLTTITNYIQELFKMAHISPKNGDWTAAIVTLVIGLFAGFGFLIRSIKNLNEAKEHRKERARARVVEEDENFMRYRERFSDLWLELSKDGKAHLYKNFCDKKSIMEVIPNKDEIYVGRIKTTVYTIMTLLSDIEFIYCSKQETPYWKRWHSTFKFVFNKPLFKTAFYKHYDVLKESNESFVEYIEAILENEKISKEIVLNNQESEKLINIENKS